MRRCFSVLALALSLSAVAEAQTVSTGISRDSVRVGDPVRAVVRIDNIPANAEVLLPDTLIPSEDVENAGRVRLRRDTLENGQTRISAAYPLILWRPGETQLPKLPIVIRAGGSDRTMQVTLPVVNVLSVLPPDTTNIEAKPAKDVWGGNRLWWPYLVAAALLLLIAGALVWWYRKRRKAQVEVPIIPFIDPRERAVKELERIRALDLIEQGQFKRHYILVSEVLRAFAGALESDWSTDLTTEELAPRLARRSEAAPLLKLLRSADMVKFARREPTAAEARGDLDAAEAWVRSFGRRPETAEAA